MSKEWLKIPLCLHLDSITYANLTISISPLPSNETLELFPIVIWVLVRLSRMIKVGRVGPRTEGVQVGNGQIIKLSRQVTAYAWLKLEVFSLLIVFCVVYYIQNCYVVVCYKLQYETPGLIDFIHIINYNTMFHVFRCYYWFSNLSLAGLPGVCGVGESPQRLYVFLARYFTLCRSIYILTE